MKTSKTIAIGDDFRLSSACELIAEHWGGFKAGEVLNLNLSKVGYLDPAIVAMFILVETYFPGNFKIIHPNQRADKIIKRVDGREHPGTIFPAQRVLGCINGGTLEGLKFWLSFVLKKFYNAPRNSSADFVELASIELINNILDHSESEHGGIIVAASFAKKKHFELTVIDFGKTIPGTLEELYPGQSDQEIMTKSLDFGVSRRYGSERNYGRGLDIIKSYSLQDNECSLRMISRRGFLSITDAQLHVRPCNYTFPGTLVKCCFSEKFVKHHLEFSEGSEELEL